MPEEKSHVRYKARLSEEQFSRYRKLTANYGADPGTIEDPEEFNLWAIAVTEYHARLLEAVRSPNGQAFFKDWIQNPIWVRDDQGNRVTGVPPEIRRRFPRIVQRSLQGELYATTERMMDIAADRVERSAYAELGPTDLPSESGLLILPAGLWGYEKTEEGLIWDTAISWAVSDNAITVIWWDAHVTYEEFERDERYSIYTGLNHVWSMRLDKAEVQYGKLRRPETDEALLKSFTYIGATCELIRMLQEEIKSTRPITPHQPRAVQRRAKRIFKGRVPSVRTYDLRRRVYEQIEQSDRTGQGAERELKYRKKVRPFYRTLNRGTPEERVVPVRGSTHRPDLPPHPNEQKNRVGLLRR